MVVDMTEKLRSRIRQTVAVIVLTAAVIGAVSLVIYVVSHLWGLIPAALIVAVVACGKANDEPKRKTSGHGPSVPTHIPHPFTINWVKRPW